MCERYAPVKNDFLYRGDVLDAVPFVTLDAEEIKVEAPGEPSLLRAPFVLESESADIQNPVACIAQLERLPGVVLLRTCEANKRPHKLKAPPRVLVAPIRLFAAFGIDATTGRPFYELVLQGFPVEDAAEEVGECYRFMVLQQCEEHGLADGGLICFREAQPVPIRHLLRLRKIARLAIETVNVMDYRFGLYMQQQPDGDKGDSAPEGPDSPIAAASKKRAVRRAERAVASDRSRSRVVAPAWHRQVGRTWIMLLQTTGGGLRRADHGPLGHPESGRMTRTRIDSRWRYHHLPR